MRRFFLLPIFLLIVFPHLFSTGQPYSYATIISMLGGELDSLSNRMETLIPEDLPEMTGTWAKVMIYENTMKSKDSNIRDNQHYLYSISDLLKMKEDMNKQDGNNKEDYNVRLRKLKPISGFSLNKNDKFELNLMDMTLRKKKLQEMMLEILFRVGQQRDDVKNGEGVFLEIDGLVVDQTVSKIGRDFYEIFFANWNPPEELNNFSVTIKEMPPRMNRVSVSVIINDDVVFSSFLSPKRDIVEAYAIYAIERALQFLIEREDVSRTLEEGDMSGTGIF